MGHLIITTRIRAPVERCFDAARSVAAHAESAKFSHETLVEPGKLDGYLELGDLVCFEGRHFGIRQRFCARVVEMNRPRVFVDEMVRGAFRSLRHVHAFAEWDGHTTMTDTLDWQAPLGILGRIADVLFLERHMRWFVVTKQTALKEMLESSLV